MVRSLRRLAPLLMFALMGPQLADAAPPKIAPPTATPTKHISPKTAGPVLDIQGEYVGQDAAKRPIGVQVVALPEGKLSAVLFEGGLPGAGWKNGMPRSVASGALSDKETKLQGDGWSVVIAHGQQSLELEKAGQKVTLQKTHRTSPTIGRKPPQGAVVLFDGHGVDRWTGTRQSADGLLEVGGTTKDEFRDYTMHVEFLIPFQPEWLGQVRGNSGLFLQNRYELQILDSFGVVPGITDCGSIYRVKTADVNACFPPLTWQTYDIEFRSARFNDKKERIEPAKISVKLNGIPVHENLILEKMSPNYVEGEYPGVGPLFVQNHGDPVHFRNIWVLEHNE